jgi:predicted DNA-binding WGR domain protein
VTVGFWETDTIFEVGFGASSRPVAHRPTSISMFGAGCRFLGFRMPDDLRSPIKHHLVLHRIDPEQGIRRFYSLMVERDLFGTVRLVRNWGRIGTNGRELVEVFPDKIEAGQALEALAEAKRRRGYRDL